MGKGNEKETEWDGAYKSARTEGKSKREREKKWQENREKEDEGQVEEKREEESCTFTEGGANIWEPVLLYIWLKEDRQFGIGIMKITSSLNTNIIKRLNYQ